MCTAIPVMLSAVRVISPVWSPQRTSSPSCLTASRIWQAHLIARAGPSNVAIPRPRGFDQLAAVRQQRPSYALPEAVVEDAPAPIAYIAHPLGRPDDIREQNRGEEAVAVTVLRPRPGDELLDRTEQVGLGQRPVVGTVALKQAGIREISAR